MSGAAAWITSSGILGLIFGVAIGGAAIIGAAAILLWIFEPITGRSVLDHIFPGFDEGGGIVGILERTIVSGVERNNNNNLAGGDGNSHPDLYYRDPRNWMRD